MIDTKELRDRAATFGSDYLTDEEWVEVISRLEAAENENAKLRIALAEKVTSEATLRDLNFGNGFINATFEGATIQLMVDALANKFVESGASNYIEMQFHSKATGPLLFTLQRVDGKTPHQLRAEAEKERDALRARIEQMEKQGPVAHVWRCDNGQFLGLNERFLPMGTKLYALPVVAPKLDEIKIALKRALELGRRETWTGARKHRSREAQREEQQCWNKVWSLLDAQGE